MATVKLTGVDEIHNSTTSFTVSDAAKLLQNVSSASHGDSLIYSNGTWGTGQVATSGGGGATLADTGIEISQQTVNGVTDTFFDYGSTPTMDLNIINPADGQVLAYVSSTGQWVNSTAAGGGGGTTLSDVGITFDVQAGDNVWEVDPTPSTTAFSVQKTIESDGSISFDFPRNL